MAKCTARAKRTGERCKQDAMHGTNVCYHHGGKAAILNKGTGNGNYKSGRYSKYLPSGLKERYEAGISDPELLQLNHEIALVDGLMTALLENIDLLSVFTLAKKLQATADSYEAERVKMQKDYYANKMIGLIEELSQEVQNYDQLLQLLEQRRRLSESERKRLVEAQQTVKVEKAMVLIDKLVDSVRRNVNDKEALARIVNDVTVFIAAAS